MTIDEYYSELHSNGYTVIRRVEAGGTANLLLQGRDRNDMAMIEAPERQLQEQRIETMSRFLRTYVG